MQTAIALESVGTRIINKRRVPVYRLPSGGEYVEQIDSTTGRSLVLSVEGALALKNGQYPLHPTLEIAPQHDDVPLALRDDAARTEHAQRSLRALMDRLIDVKVSLTSREN